MSKPKIVIQGRTDWAPFRQAELWLRQRFEITSAEVPEVVQAVILVQRYPEDIPASEFIRLRERFPSAQWVIFSGPWCDGELRTRSNHREGLFVRWHAWEAEFPLILQPKSVLPRTTSELERILSRRRSIAMGNSNRRVAIYSADRETQANLEELVARSGGSPVHIPQVQQLRTANVGGLVLDLESPEELQLDLAMWRGTFQRLPTIATTGFARPEEVEYLTSLGIVSVVSKPFAWAHWERAVANVVTPRIQQTDAA